MFSLTNFKHFLGQHVTKIVSKKKINNSVWIVVYKVRGVKGKLSTFVSDNNLAASERAIRLSDAQSVRIISTSQGHAATSDNETYYFVGLNACTCPNYEHRSTDDSNYQCKHMLALKNVQSSLVNQVLRAS